MRNSEKFWWSVFIILYIISDCYTINKALSSNLEEHNGMFIIIFSIIINVIPFILIILSIASGVEFLINKFNNWLDK